jgi:hypothetical protein
LPSSSAALSVAGGDDSGGEAALSNPFAASAGSAKLASRSVFKVVYLSDNVE